MNTLLHSVSRNARLHLGCGKSKLPGHIGVDISPQPVVDIICDLQHLPWPFKDSSISACVLLNVLEHLSDTLRVMEEIWRVTESHALVRISVPYYNSLGAFQDPTHVTFFTEHTFDYFTEDGKTFLSHYNYYTHARFEIMKLDFDQRKVFSYLPRRIQVLLAHHFATVHSLNVVLRTIKQDTHSLTHP